jgi:hypothetical protein
MKATEASISEIQKQLGGHESEAMIDTQKARLLIACDNTYSTPAGKDGLLRIQMLPPAGKEYAYLSINGANAPAKYTIDQMDPIYMRTTGTGREVFGSVPEYFGFDGVQAGGEHEKLLALFSLPLLPEKGVKPGEAFTTGFHQFVPMLNENAVAGIMAGKITTGIPARGTLEAIEWEGGIPCAKLHSTIEVGADAAKTSIDSVYWFALDRRCIVKYILVVTQEVKVTGDGAGGSQATGGRGGGGTTMGPPGGRGGSRGGGGGIASGEGGDNAMTPQRGGGRGGGSRGGGGMMGPPGAAGRGGGVMGPPGAGGSRGGGGNTGGNRGSNTQFVRVRNSFIVTLEK